MGARLWYASGAAGCVGAALVLAGRFPASVALCLILVQAARTGAGGALLEGGPARAGRAANALTAQLALMPAWAVVAAAGAVRAASGSIADVRGANAVAGLAIARGPALTVAGSWLALAAGILALSASWSSSETEAAIPGTLRRLELAGAAAQAALLVTLFAGPQIRGAADAVPWVAFGAGIAVVVLAARRVRPWGESVRAAAGAATLVSLIGLALVLAGGHP